MSQPLTFLVTCFGRPDKLRACLASIRDHHPTAYIVVADNSVEPLNHASAGIDGQVKYMRVDGDQIGNLPAARNAGLAEIKTPWFVLLEDDMRLLSPTAVDMLYGICQRHRADIVGGRVSKPGNVKWDWAGNFRREHDGLRVLPSLPDRGVQRVDLLPNFFVGRTSFFKRLPWNKEFPIAGEHLDYFLTAKLANAKVLWQPKAEVLHDRGGDADYQRFRNRRYYNELLTKWGVNWVRLPSMYRHEWRNGQVLGVRVEEATAVVVWTTGRAGSSAVGQVLHRLGVSMGDCLLEPHDREAAVNRNGYYEDHSACLAGWALGRPKEHRAVIEEELRDHCHRMADRSVRFGIKAPGLAHDPDLVLRALAGAGVKTVRHVWAKRDMAAVMSSLHAAGWVADEAKSRERMEERARNIESLFARLPGSEKLVVDFDDLVANPVEHCVRLAGLVGVEDKALVAAAAAGINPALKRH